MVKCSSGGVSTPLCSLPWAMAELGPLPKECIARNDTLMSIIGLLCLFFGLAAALLLALLLLQRRSIKALREVSLEVQRAAIGGSITSRIELSTPQPELAALLTAVNHLLSRVAVESERAVPS